LMGYTLDVRVWVWRLGCRRRGWGFGVVGYRV